MNDLVVHIQISTSHDHLKPSLLHGVTSVSYFFSRRPLRLCRGLVYLLGGLTCLIIFLKADELEIEVGTSIRVGGIVLVREGAQLIELVQDVVLDLLNLLSS